MRQYRYRVLVLPYLHIIRIILGYRGVVDAGGRYRTKVLVRELKLPSHNMVRLLVRVPYRTTSSARLQVTVTERPKAGTVTRTVLYGTVATDGGRQSARRDDDGTRTADFGTRQQMRAEGSLTTS